MTKAIIFDLNGVFIKSPKLSNRFNNEFGVPIEEFLVALKEIMAKIRMPNSGDAFLYWKPYLEKWGIDLTEENFFDFWFGAEKENSEMTTLAKELKNKDIKIFILSNNFAERAAYYEQNFLFLKEIADKIYYSWQTGFVKPDENAYKLILSENNLKPEECFYFDDSEENIKVANALGIKSFIFKDTESVRKFIK